MAADGDSVSDKVPALIKLTVLVRGKEADIKNQHK